jgi:hypothetical protein
MLTDVIGAFPYRMALAGGWIDQPFLSRLNPHPPGSMVVVAIEPICRFMDRCGMGTSTRNVAAKLWGDRPPEGDPAPWVRQLYEAENHGRAEPSGSQDMIGLLYPGINRLDYDASHEEGYFPIHIESCHDPEILAWLERVVYLLPVNQRPQGYAPLGIKHLNPGRIQALGQSGKDCYAAILARDASALGASLNACMECWEALAEYQKNYAGAMYSGCGGGYLYVISETPVPGAFQVKIRQREKHSRAFPG